MSSSKGKANTNNVKPTVKSKKKDHGIKRKNDELVMAKDVCPNNNNAEHTDDFSLASIDAGDLNSVAGECQYVKKLLKCSDLYILQPAQVDNAYDSKGALGLFHLFLTKRFLGTTIRKWTNNNLQANGHDKIGEPMMLAYIGLEFAMSIIQFNEIEEYWSKDMFLGSINFQRVMSRDNFQSIRAHLKLTHSEESEDSELAAADPLWHSRKLLEHFQVNCASVAVPTGCSALDENTCRTKACSRARSYIKNKPHPYGVQFYTVVGSKYQYLFSFWDNHSGNKTGKTPVSSYTAVFCDMRGPVEKMFVNNGPIPKDSASALWITQIAHQVKKIKASSVPNVGDH